MKRIISTIIAVIMLLTLVSCGNTQKANWSEHLEAGQKFLLDGNYEQAIIEFNKVIEIEPRNVDAYIGLADVYVAQGDYERAIEVLKKGYAETQSSEIQDRINEINGIAAGQTGVTKHTEAPFAEATTSTEPDPVAEDFAWTFEDGVLTISGHGRMPDYKAYNGFPWYDRLEEIKEVVIENGITSIGEMSFFWCSGITKITIPDSVTSIGEHALWACESLISVEIPDSVTSIGGSAFGHCTYLTSVTIPNSVTSIGDSAFRGCTNLISVTIPDSVTSIGDCAFDYCISLTSIAIPNSVTSIGNNPFEGCSNLTEIIVNNNAQYCNVDGVLFTKDMTELISYPAGKQSGYYSIPDSVKYIGWGAFSGCSSLTGIAIPDSITSIGHGAFVGCESLTNITIPVGVTDLPGNLFLGCDSLTGITIPDSVTSIGNDAFYGCDSLTGITIPDSVTSIGNEAFYGCYNLTDIYCEAESKPTDWDDNWLSNRYATVHWGYKG